MNHTQREPGDPFASPDTPTLQTVLDRLDILPDITPARRNDLRSAIRTFCKLTGRDPRDIVAGPVRIRHLLTQCKPARHGISHARWNNVRSLLSRAMDLAEIRVSAGNMLAPMQHGWEALYEQLPTKHMKCHMSRLFRHLSVRGVSPQTVTLADIEHCETDNLASVLSEPLRGNQRLRKTWMRARRMIQGWPDIHLDVPDLRKTYGVADELLPSSYVADVEAFLTWSGRYDAFDDETGPIRPVRQSTVKNKRHALRAMVSAAIRNGVPIDGLRSLADLVEPDTVRAALRFLAEHHGEQRSATLEGRMAQIVIVARDWVKVPQSQLDVLRKLAGRVAPDHRGGMTEQNRGILREFEDPKLVLRLVQLPDALFELACREPIDGWVRGQKQSGAVAVAILLAAPIRVLNLSRIQIGRNLVRIGADRGHRYELYFAPDEVKNSIELSMPLPAWVSSFIDRYLEDGRRTLTEVASPWLFPGLPGWPVTTCTMTTRIGAVTERHLGVRMTPHKFRHVAGALHIRDNPAQHEVVRRLLGHKNLSTTLDFYAGMEQSAATRHYSTTIEARRQELLQNPALLETAARRRKKGRSE